MRELQIYMPSLMSDLAVSVELIYSMAYASHWSLALFASALIHLALVIDPLSRLLTSLISLRCLLSLGLNVTETLGTIRLYCLPLRWESTENFEVNSCSMDGSLSQTTISLLASVRTMALVRVFSTETTAALLGFSLS